MLAEDESAERLTAPLQFFVEVSTYTAMTGQPPNDSELAYKKFNGVVLTGVPCATLADGEYQFIPIHSRLL